MDYGQFSALMVVLGLLLVGLSSLVENQKDRWKLAAQNFGAAALLFGLISCVFVAADLFTISFS